jgi:wyosine [tRNA(Phe)-imidazoG37] synthetase (radical SAM superfamily)
MSTFLFNEIVFGPVRSRRLGVSLGINLLPVDKKYCNFDCIYCECGWSGLSKVKSSDLPSREATFNALQERLKGMSLSGKIPDVITFAGNGEPTMHPEFEDIMKDTVMLRDHYCPSARIAVLCNSTLIHKSSVANGLSMADQSILKLDTVFSDTYNILNKPAHGIELKSIISNLAGMGGDIILQTMFIRGEYLGRKIDNTTPEEIDGLTGAYKKINPGLIMIYTFQRDTAAEGLEKISLKQLKEIGKKIEAEGLKVEISG